MTNPGVPGPLVEGKNLEVDPPRRLVQTMTALWSDEAKAVGESRVTWEIEPVGDSCRLLLIHDQLPDGRREERLRRLAADPVRAQDVARDRRGPHHARLADVHVTARHDRPRSGTTVLRAWLAASP